MHKAPTGTTLAFDFGEARIGVAEGDAEVGTAHPLATVTGEGNEAKFAAIAKLVTEWQPRQLVVGLPAHTDGSEHELTRLCRKFGRRRRSFPHAIDRVLTHPACGLAVLGPLARMSLLVHLPVEAHLVTHLEAVSDLVAPLVARGRKGRRRNQTQPPHRWRTHKKRALPVATP